MIRRLLLIVVMTLSWGVAPVFALEESTAGTTVKPLRPTGPALVKPMVERPLQERILNTVKSALMLDRAAIGTGEVTAINGTTLTVAREDRTFTVLTTDKTQFRGRFWGKEITLADIQVGHTVNVAGHWTDSTKTQVEAKLIRDLDLQYRFGVFVGEIKSLTSTGFVMTTITDKRTDQTVQISAETKLYDRTKQIIGQSELLVGHRVRVRGLWDKVTNLVTSVDHVVDYSIPANGTEKIKPL